MKFRLPNKINGDKLVAVISPSGEPEKNDLCKELLEEAKNFCSTKGIKLNFIDGWNKTFRGYAGTKQDKVETFNKAVQSEDNVVMSSIGGYGAFPIISQELISNTSNSNKWYVGMSDTASVLNAITFNTGLITIYGIDVVWGLGKFSRGETFEGFNKIITDHDFSELEKFPISRLSGDLSMNVQGRLMGGCLSSFTSLLGTNFDPIASIEEDFILVIEDVGMDLRRIEDLFYQLKFNEKFNKYCKAIIMGNFAECINKHDPSITAEVIAQEVFTNMPIFKSENIGHGVSNIPLPIGAIMNIHTERDKITTKYSIN